VIQPASMRFFLEPESRLRLTVDESYSVVEVVPAWAAPLTNPDRYLCFLNPKGEEVTMVESLNVLDESSRSAVEFAIAQRYLTSRIERILEARVEFGATYWTVQTNRGVREFVAQSLQENAQWMGENHLLLIDIDGNRFEILDTTVMDAQSQKYIDTIL